MTKKDGTQNFTKFEMAFIKAISVLNIHVIIVKIYCNNGSGTFYYQKKEED